LTWLKQSPMKQLIQQLRKRKKLTQSLALKRTILVVSTWLIVLLPHGLMLPITAWVIMEVISLPFTALLRTQKSKPWFQELTNPSGLVTMMP
jgi:hypothetical protein